MSTRRSGRAAEGTRLENVRSFENFRGFESHLLRHKRCIERKEHQTGDTILVMMRTTSENSGNRLGTALTSRLYAKSARVIHTTMHHSYL